MSIEKIIDCPQCGRHYEETEDEPLTDIENSLASTGFCFDGCKQESEKEG